MRSSTPPQMLHTYLTHLRWTGNLGTGTSAYRAYSRDHEIRVSGKPLLLGSSDPAFRGNPTRHNPEDIFVAALSACHMLWYLHLCADAGIVITAYEDQATGRMEVSADGGGRFTEVLLHPQVTLSDINQAQAAAALHEVAHRYCFLANSCNFPVRHEAAFFGPHSTAP